MAKANGDNGHSDIDAAFGDDMLDAALDDAIQAAVAAGEEALAEVAASNAERNSEQIEVPLMTSGILDIQKLSQTYEAERSARRPETESEPIPEVPMLGSARSLHVLAPQPADAGGGDRWLYFVLGFGSAVVLTSAVFAVMYFLVLRGGGDAQDRRATTQAPAVATAPSETADTRAAVAAPAVAGTPPAAPATAPDDVAPVATNDDRDDDDDDDHDRAKRGDKDRDKDRDRDEDRDRDKDRDRSKDRDRTNDRVADVPPDPNPPADDPPPAASGGAACDEVECLMDPSKPCCVKSGLGQSTATTRAPAKPASDLPERPSRADVANAMRKVKGRVQSCADRHGFEGTVRIRFTVSADGAVDSASTPQGPAEFKSCVADVVGSAAFPASQKGITVTYPLLIK